MDHFSEPSQYQTYVLRLWREQAASHEHPAEWRFVLEEPRTGQKRGFTCLEALMGFLEDELKEQKDKQ